MNDHLAQEGAGADRDDGANDLDRSRHVESAWDDVVHVRPRRGAQHAIDRREQFDERERQRRLRRRRLCRKEGAREVIASFLAAALEHVDDLAHLLILEQASYELRAGILPLLLFAGGEQELGFDPAAISRYSAASFSSRVRMHSTNCCAIRAIGMS